MSLTNKLLNYTKEVYPMHMPGHKGGRYKLMDDPYKVDVTEVPGTDHLYQAQSILASSMKKLRKFYGTRKSFYLVNGSTVGLLSAIGGLHKAGDEVLIARNCHQSVYNGVALFQLKPIYIYPKMTQWDLVGGIDPEKVRAILASHPKVVSFAMTSPTYDGFISDVGVIKSICDDYNVTLIVDEAHGAHLPYSDLLPESALRAKAGIVIHSLHKTLPVITGAGLMHLNLPKEQEEGVLAMLSKLQTSSPSYMMMANMDACVKQLGNNANLWINLLKNVNSMNTALKKMKKLYALTDYSSYEEGVMATDPLKSNILVRRAKIHGHEVASRMRQHYKIQMELGDLSHVLGIITPADNKKALAKYAKALIHLDKKLKRGKGTLITLQVPKSIEYAMTPYEASQHAIKKIPLKDAVGAIAAESVTPYPPGIPVITVGEPYTIGMVEHIQHWLDIGMDVLGVEAGKVAVVDS